MSSSFEYNSENKKKLEGILTRYPRKRAALLPALHLALDQEGYISPGVEETIAELLEIPLVDVREVVSFYSMFHQKPQGKHHVKVCESLSCWLRGSDEVRQFLREKLGIESGQVTGDGEFSWEGIPDCLGACELAPMMQVDGYFEGNLTREKVERILEQKSNAAASGKK